MVKLYVLTREDLENKDTLAQSDGYVHSLW